MVFLPEGGDSTHIATCTLPWKMQRPVHFGTPAAANQYQKIGKPMTQFHELKMDAITGESVDFSTYQDTMCLVVNVASR